VLSSSKQITLPGLIYRMHEKKLLKSKIKIFSVYIHCGILYDVKL